MCLFWTQRKIFWRKFVIRLFWGTIDLHSRRKNTMQVNGAPELLCFPLSSEYLPFVFTFLLFIQRSLLYSIIRYFYESVMFTSPRFDTNKMTCLVSLHLNIDLFTLVPENVMFVWKITPLSALTHNVSMATVDFFNGKTGSLSWFKGLYATLLSHSLR